jgi:Cu-processing system permease protein
MSPVLKIARYQFVDLLRSRWFIGYLALLVLATELILRMGGMNKLLLTLASAVLLVLPLVSLTFGTSHFYNSRDFTELLLAQPLPRAQLFLGLYLALALPLAAGVFLATGLPLLIHGDMDAAQLRVWLLIVQMSVVLAFCFVGIAFLIACLASDKTRGMGAALLVWLVLALLFDALLLIAVDVFADYPLDTAVLLAVFLNPIDLARTIIMMQMDAAALMGYSGAVFARFLNSTMGAGAAALTLLAWAAAPAWLAGRRFRKQDF